MSVGVFCPCCGGRRCSCAWGRVLMEAAHAPSVCVVTRCYFPCSGRSLALRLAVPALCAS